jgi:hypothetical protein
VRVRGMVAVSSLIGMTIYVLIGVALLPTIITATNSTNVPGATATQLVMLGLIGTIFIVPLVMAPLAAVGLA